MTHDFSSQHARQLRHLTRAYNRPAARTVSSSSFWQALLKLATGSSEPVIRQENTSARDISYTVYDPISEQQITGLSEAEARAWLEQRYSQ